MKRHLAHSFQDIVSTESLLYAWPEFLRGKRTRRDVQYFQFYLTDNIFVLRDDLADKTYRHGQYNTFHITDPKPRVIHKAPVRDRLVHHALYKILYPFFDKTFIANSYSCRESRGTHKAIGKFNQLARKVGENHAHTCWVLKCDIKQFFANINHQILLRILGEYIPDKDIMWLCKEIISSFHSSKPGVGLPLGNLTSQLFVNIYMNKFDQFVKHEMKTKYYIRYADDFVVMSRDKSYLLAQIFKIREFLKTELQLTAHKISIRTVASGVDFLGWVHFPDYRVLRTATKRRMFRNISNSNGDEVIIQSYLGLLSHGNTHKLQGEILELVNIYHSKRVAGAV